MPPSGHDHDCESGGRRAAALPAGLSYLLAKLKAPRDLRRLPETAARAREQGGPTKSSSKSFLEAEVFARDASGAHQRIRHAAFPPAA